MNAFLENTVQRWGDTHTVTATGRCVRKATLSVDRLCTETVSIKWGCRSEGTWFAKYY